MIRTNLSIMDPSPSKIFFIDKLRCSHCNKPLMGEVLIASNGQTICQECHQKSSANKP
ncbi:MAG: hypothetical protein LUQ50_13270 [Methanospirillum sp.]|uniref:LIM domain-containing protein n=1 Tax=Methanospirillum sp. TaxID=45200 RepID=UPI002369F2CE|nr:LIM domain-containing protein [Methanospirillum sp.]MDD1730025.1 hypothetical protein [Methanospirillum sp.]